MEKHIVNITVRGKGVRPKSTKLSVYKFKPADYYNERADFLESKEYDKESKKEIRLIYQKVYDELAELRYDTNSIDYDIELYSQSVLMKNTIKGQQFKKLWDDSRADQPLLDASDKPGLQYDETSPNRRREQSAIIIWDVINLRIKMIQESDKFNTAYNCGQNNLKNLNNITYYKNNKGLVVISTIHTHPNKKFEVIKHINGGVTSLQATTLPYLSSSNDAKYSQKFKIPCFQIDPSEGGLFLQRESKSKSRFISKEIELFKGNVDIAKISLDEVNIIRE